MRHRVFDGLSAFFEATGLEAHGVMVDMNIFEKAQLIFGSPRTYDSAEPDLRARAFCAAIDAGCRLANSNDDFLGTGPDLGALQYGAATRDYGPRQTIP